MPPLTKAQQEDLKDPEVHKFGKCSIGKLEHGFRIRSQAGQPAAIYWSNLYPGNQVEIALAPERLSTHYDTRTILAWLRLMREEYPKAANAHKASSGWPTLGFNLEEAKAFLVECSLLRQGLLRDERLLAIQEHLSHQSSEVRQLQLLEEQLEQLRPTQAHAVIDLVYRAGISVKCWYVTEDGRTVTKPRSNPAYRFRWAFGGGAEPSLASLWHASIEIADGHLQYTGNYRQAAVVKERIAGDGAFPADQRSRAQLQGARARQLDELVQGVGQGGELRVILNEGEMRDESQLAEESSHVRVRRLDVEPWIVHRYDAITGDCVLRRMPRAAGRKLVAPPEPRYIDQHDLPGSDSPERTFRMGSGFIRDAAVRKIVLERAKGQCELCDAEGFLTPDGARYLETHHVVPLSQGGADREWNVVGLCPGHHREAHHGQRRDDLAFELKQYLLGVYPDMAAEAEKPVACLQ